MGTRFNTICHGDMWMGNLMFRKNPESDESEECYMIDLHSAQYLSPATGNTCLNYKNKYLRKCCINFDIFVDFFLND